MGNKTQTSILSMANFVSKECIPCIPARSESRTWRSRLLALLHWGLHVADRRLGLLIYSICDPSDQWRAERGEHSSPHLCFGDLSYCTPYWGLCKAIVRKHCQIVPRPWRHGQLSSHFRHSELLALSLCLTCLWQQPHYCCEDTEFSLCSFSKPRS